MQLFFLQVIRFFFSKYNFKNTSDVPDPQFQVRPDPDPDFF